MDANLVYVDAIDRFLGLLEGVEEPEKKRKIIGAEFIRVFEEEARKLEGIEFLAQGTIYPDITEYRQPFPGPGLGVRCTGAITRDRLEAVREADAIVREELDKMVPTPWQYFVAIPDLKSVGVKDDKRYMGWAAIIRAVNTVDAVTAQSVEIPWETLCRMRDRIIAEVPGINRVLWDISDKPVATIEWE